MAKQLSLRLAAKFGAIPAPTMPLSTLGSATARHPMTVLKENGMPKYKDAPPGYERQPATFDEFCFLFNVTAAERNELAWFLAMERAKKLYHTLAPWPGLRRDPRLPNLDQQP